MYWEGGSWGSGASLPNPEGISPSKEARTVASLFKRFYLIVIASLVAMGVAAQAQQYDSPYLPPPADSGGPAVPGVEPTGPAIPGVSDTPTTWPQQRTTTNRAGTVLNTQRWAVAEDGSQYQREHEVTNPRGEMIQSWERAQNEEGYLYRRWQTSNAPDGTQLRQHERSLSETDPYNYTRQQQVQLRDGRTITHDQTRSWDGTTGTMERTFTGPNGQQRYFERPWTPDDPSSPPPGAVVPSPPPVGPPPVAEPKQNKMRGWLEKLNPFRKGGPLRPSKPASPPPPRGSGFTIAPGQHRGMDHVPQGLSKKQPGEPSPNWRRPPWAGNPHTSSPPQRTSLPPTASRPTSSHGKNR